ncbi:MAG: pilus assembly protein [Actinomycetota bacterium]|nr:pilus assembly protein [Actinomycetota bacterium]
MAARAVRVESGQASTEAVLIVPVLLLLIMFVIQFGLWYHAEHVVQAAAQEGVRSARLEGGSAEMGRRRAERFLARAGSRVVSQPVVRSSRDSSSATVAVEGHAVAVVPGLRLPVRANAVSPVEEFRAEAAP